MAATLIRTIEDLLWQALAREEANRTATSRYRALPYGVDDSEARTRVQAQAYVRRAIGGFNARHHGMTEARGAARSTGLA